MSLRVANEGDVAGVFCGLTNADANIAATIPFGMEIAIRKGWIENACQATKWAKVLRQAWGIRQSEEFPRHL